MRRILVLLLSSLFLASCASISKQPEVPLVFDSGRPVFPALYVSLMENGGTGFKSFDPFTNEYKTSWIRTTALNFGIQPVNIRYQLQFNVLEKTDVTTISIVILNPEIEDLRSGDWRKTSLDQASTRARFGSKIKEFMELPDDQWEKATRGLFSDPAFLHGLKETLNLVAFNKLLDDYQILGTDYAISVPFIGVAESNENSAFKFRAVGSFEPQRSEEDTRAAFLDSLTVVLYTNDASLFLSARPEKVFTFRGALKGLVQGDQLEPYLLLEL